MAIVQLLFQVTALVVAASAMLTWDCPEVCVCGPVRDRWTYEMEFTVNCSNVGLKTVPRFNASGKVDELDLVGNSISVLENNTFIGILPKKVNLRKNRISVIEPNAFIDICNVTIDLDLSSNKLTELPQGLDKMAALKSLTLTLNTNLKISEGSFRGLISLEKLVLSECYLKNIPNKTFDDVSGSLQELYLEYNGLEQIPKAVQNLKRLKKINFGFNAITHVPADAFQGLSKLQELSLDGNDLNRPDSIHASSLSEVAGSLKFLDLSQSNIVTCPTEQLASLKHLKMLILSSNRIENFPEKAFQSLDSLILLNLSGNPAPMTQEMFVGVEDTLQKLDINGNKLIQLPVQALQNLRQLQWLDASSNTFTVLGDNFTKGIHANRYTLQRMKISEISTKAFLGKKRPVYLDLGYNELTSLDFIVNPCDFEFVDVRNNPIVCDCHTLFIAMHIDLILNGNCVQPESLSGLDLSGKEFKNVAFQLCNSTDNGTGNKTEKNIRNIYCPEPSELADSCEGLNPNLCTLVLVFFIKWLS